MLVKFAIGLFAASAFSAGVDARWEVRVAFATQADCLANKSPIGAFQHVSGRRPRSHGDDDVDDDDDSHHGSGSHDDEDCTGSTAPWLREFHNVVNYDDFKGNLTGAAFNRFEAFSDAACSVSEQISYSRADDSCHVARSSSYRGSKASGKFEVFPNSLNCTGTVQTFEPTSTRNACQTQTAADGTKAFFMMSASPVTAYLSTGVMFMSVVASALLFA